jgi:serine protease Do
MQKSPSPWSFVDSSRVNRWTMRGGAALLALAVLAPGTALAEPPYASPPPVNLVPDPVEVHTFGPTTAPPAQLPPRPGQAPAKVPAAKIDDKAGHEMSPQEKALRGIVIVERNGQALGLGGVLGGDGRVITALSPLGAGNDLSVRFADGSVVKAKIGHNDRAWDLALLVPQTGKWQEGLVATSREPVRQDASMHGFTIVRGKPALTSIVLRSHKRMLGGDDRILENAIELGSRVNPLDLGAPIIDEEGRVVGILGRGCLPNEGRACTPVAFGAPMQAVRSFLRTVPATAVQPSAWLGIQGVSESFGAARGVRVVVVHPESPADEAKLRGGDRTQGDVIVAVDGTPVGNPEALAEAIKTHGVGEKVPLLVLSGGKYRTVTVHLRAAPEPKGPQSPSAAELPSDQAPSRAPVRRYYP